MTDTEARVTTPALERRSSSRGVTSAVWRRLLLTAAVLAVLLAARPPSLRLRAAIALLVLAGIAARAADLLRRPAEEPLPTPAHAPGQDPSLLGGITRASADTSFRILAGLGIALLAVWNVVLSPSSVRATIGGEERTVTCGARDFLFGADDSTTTALCRDGYAARAAGGLLVLVAVGIVVAMMAWLVQYHRGAALGSVWHRSGVPSALLARTGGGCALLAVIALVLVPDRGAPVEAPNGAELASAPLETAAAPIAEDVAPRPTIAADLPHAPAPGGAASPSATAPASTPNPPTTGGPTSAAPLIVRDASWFAASRTLLDDMTVPAGSLPIGATGGEDDMHAFFRLTGTATTLTLVEGDDPGSQRFPDRAALAACPVTTAAWEQTSGGSFEDEPPLDRAACVEAVRADDGTWTIDLAVFEDRGGDRGFGLVPVGAAGATFRVALEAAR